MALEIGDFRHNLWLVSKQNCAYTDEVDLSYVTFPRDLNTYLLSTENASKQIMF
jgi:hypothetical protein